LQKQIKTKEMNKLEIFISNHTFIRRFSNHVQVLYIDAVKDKNVAAGILFDPTLSSDDKTI
jgi:hypothetical protein